MNEKKFCFITCVNDPQYYNECLYYINNLEVPHGYEVDILSVEKAKSIASGYNEGMSSSDAKYKIYLHQDIFIKNRRFLNDILKVFKSDDKVGMIGVAGGKKIPITGVWWEASECFGKLFENRANGVSELKFKEVEGIYEEVEGIDGVIIATQYDIKWREDIFEGWHFYDVSQSLEFKRRGHKIVIPRQESSWCLHDCEEVSLNGYDKYKNIFLHEYFKEIFL